MKLVNAQAFLVTPEEELREFPVRIEKAGRTAYQSQWKFTTGSAEKFMKMLIDRGHESVLEHCSFTAKFICDRGVSHELVRHRVASFTQESTRYCNYAKGRFGSELTFIRQPFWEPDTPKYDLWMQALRTCEEMYIQLIEEGASPQEARSVLPNSLKTEIVVTANVREWRHIFQMRLSPAAHPQIRSLMKDLWSRVSEIVPVLFSDLLQ